jgi:hypothetical protein
MTRARDLSRLANANAISVDTTNNVGIGSTIPDAKLDVGGNLLVGTAISMYASSGIISATAFYGDGSNLEGVSSAGLGTAVEAGSLYGGEQIYYTDTVLSIGGTVTVNPPASANVAYTQYQDIAVDQDADLIVEDGDDFIPDVLGLSTEGVSPLTGAGGRVRAGSFTNKAGTGAPTLTYGAEVPVGYGITGAGGINITGVVTATSFVGSGANLTNLNIPAGFNELDAALFN